MLSSTIRITEHLRYDLLSLLCSRVKLINVEFHSFPARPFDDLWPCFGRIISILGSQAGTMVISRAFHVACPWAEFQSFLI